MSLPSPLYTDCDLQICRFRFTDIQVVIYIYTDCDLQIYRLWYTDIQVVIYRYTDCDIQIAIYRYTGCDIQIYRLWFTDIQIVIYKYTDCDLQIYRLWYRDIFFVIYRYIQIAIYRYTDCDIWSLLHLSLLIKRLCFWAAHSECVPWTVLGKEMIGKEKQKTKSPGLPWKKMSELWLARKRKKSVAFIQNQEVGRYLRSFKGANCTERGKGEVVFHLCSIINKFKKFNFDAKEILSYL